MALLNQLKQFPGKGLITPFNSILSKMVTALKVGIWHSMAMMSSSSFIQCENCKKAMGACCSTKCQEIVHLPLQEQKVLRAGIHNSNKIFKKERSEKLMFKK